MNFSLTKTGTEIVGVKSVFFQLEDFSNYRQFQVPESKLLHFLAAQFVVNARRSQSRGFTSLKSCHCDCTACKGREFAEEAHEWIAEVILTYRFQNSKGICGTPLLRMTCVAVETLLVIIVLAMQVVYNTNNNLSRSPSNTVLTGNVQKKIRIWINDFLISIFIIYFLLHFKVKLKAHGTARIYDEDTYDRLHHRNMKKSFVIIFCACIH